MNSRQTLTACLAAAVAAWIGLGTAVAAQPEASRSSDGIEVLTRGPVHEAFAVTVTFDPQPGIVVPQAPPAAIKELPPQHKPEGANVAWIPGYWAWEDDRNDFLWVSGIWRNLPPGRQWVPGYWSRTAEEFQWTSGYWADAEAREIDYLPEPPESVEAGSNIQAPSADHTWLPGCWVWQQDRYAWRPGYWTPAYANWVWTPAHYQWSPRGYVSVGGYWDHAVSRRGLLFAPVRFDQSVYSRRGFSYTPSTVIQIAGLASQLFLRPNYGHYYFGDYYGANYTRAGFFPSYSFHSSRRGYDPIYSHQRWQHRQESGWERRVQENFQYRRDHEDSRPPRTFFAQQELLRNGRTEQNRGRIFAQPLDQFVDQFKNRQDSPLQFQRLNDEDRRGFGRRGQEVRGLLEQRQKLESQSSKPAAEGSARKRKPARIEFPRSPIVGKNADKLDKNLAPPRKHAFPQPDPKVVPKPRQDRGRPAVQGKRNETKPQVKPKVKPQVKPEVKPKVKPQVKPQVKPRGKPQVKPQVKPKVKPQGKPQVKPQVKPKRGSAEKPPAASDKKPQDEPRGKARQQSQGKSQGKAKQKPKE